MKQIVLNFTDWAVKELERMRICLEVESQPLVIKRAIALLNTMNTQNMKGFTRVIMENPDTGERVELTGILKN